MFYYAQLDENNIVISISELKEEMELANLINIERFDISFLGKRYENGEFLEVPKTKEELLQDLKSQYLSQIKDADLLGDIDEKTRLQQEYLQKKTALEAGE